MSDPAEPGGRPRRRRDRSYTEADIGSLANRAALALWDRDAGLRDENARRILSEVVDVFNTLAIRVEQPYSIGAETDFLSSLKLALYLLDRDESRGNDLQTFRRSAARRFREVADGAKAVIDGTANPDTVADLHASFYRVGIAALVDKPTWGSESPR